MTTTEDKKIDSLTTAYGFSQIIFESVHILSNSSFWTELTFTRKPNLVIESRAPPFLHPNCHHQISSAKLNLKIVDTPLYKSLVWGYKKANLQLINRTIDNWKF